MPEEFWERVDEKMNLFFARYEKFHVGTLFPIRLRMQKSLNDIMETKANIFLKQRWK